jgi:hypothetical protein
MPWTLTIEGFLIALAIVAAMSFIVAIGVDSIVGEDGFGVSGSALVMTLGFFFTVFSVRQLGWSGEDVRYGVGAGLVGAFLALTVGMLAKLVRGRT